MPTAASFTYTGGGIVPFYPKDARRHSVKLPASVTYAKGTVLGEITASPGTFKAYASGSVDGSQNPRAILEYDCATDASGNITMGGASGGAEWGSVRTSVPAFFQGAFACADLVGLDATALTNNSAWKLINGTVSAGVLLLP
jgi:hypothetical protein